MGKKETKKAVSETQKESQLQDKDKDIKKDAVEESASDGTILHPIFSAENLQLLIFVCLIMWLNFAHHKLFLQAYYTETWHFYDHAMKVLMNYFGCW